MNEQWQIALLNAILSGGFENFARTCYECVLRPVYIDDAEYFKLAHYPDTPHDDLIWTDMRDYGRMSFPLIKSISDEGMIHKGHNHKSPYLVNEGCCKGHPRIVGNVFSDDEIAGHIVILCDSLEDVTTERLMFMEIASTVVALEFRHHNYGAKRISDLFDILLTHLLQGRQFDFIEQKHLFRSYEKYMRKDFSILAIQPQNKNEAQTDSMPLPTILRHIGHAIPWPKPVICDDCIYVLLLGISDEICLREKIEAIMSPLRPLSLNFGVSNMFSDIKDTRIFRDQADYALKTCQKNSNIQYEFYKNCLMSRMVEIVTENLPVQSYIHPGLNILQEYDDKNGTEYYNTISSFVLSAFNGAETISELHIHRNTLTYRLKVIKELTGIDFTDRDTRAQLLCGVYLFPFARSKSTGFSR